MIEQLSQQIASFVNMDAGLSIVKALLTILFAWLATKVLVRAVEKNLDSKMSRQGLFLLKRTIVYSIVVLVALSILREFGFKLSVLLGAAGILTVAIGFASQTSASNLISGLFLVAERPFQIGDIIRIDTLTGEVLTIDLLSIKLRTMDNLFVRVPNESIIKSNVTNISRFPIRRFDLTMKINYREDLDKVKATLMAAANSNPVCLLEPSPLFIVLGFGDSGVDIQFSAWARRENFLELRNNLAASILKSFRQQDIQIALPQLRLADSPEGTEPVQNS